MASINGEFRFEKDVDVERLRVLFRFINKRLSDKANGMAESGMS
jgi:hypothetical protein